MTVRKRTKTETVAELVSSVRHFADLLDGQKETEAAEDLRIAAGDLSKFQQGSPEFDAAISLVLNSYEGEHELDIYTHRRKGADEGNWTDADELYLASTKVLSLARRLKPS